MRLVQKIKFSLIISVVSMMIVGCSSSSGSSDDGSNLAGSEVSINTVDKAKVVLDMMNESGGVMELVTSDLTEYINVDDFPEANITSSSANKVVISCDSGNGTLTKVGTESSTSLDMEYTYDECWLGNGSSRLIGEKTILGSVDGNGYATLNISTNSYFSVGNYTMNTTSTVKFYIDETNRDEFDILLNGKIEHYYDNDPDVGETPEFYEDTIGFENFHYVVDENGHETLSGKFSISDYDESCVNGIYTLETIDKIISTQTGVDSGKVKINGTIYQFNNDGTVSLTFPDGSTGQFNYADSKDASCS